jgi:hypothetical protein
LTSTVRNTGGEPMAGALGAEVYELGVRFTKEKTSAGETVLSIPEDTSLYCLSGTICPTRLFSFKSGVLAAGKMTDDAIRKLEKQAPRYLCGRTGRSRILGRPTLAKI